LLYSHILLDWRSEVAAPKKHHFNSSSSPIIFDGQIPIFYDIMKKNPTQVIS